MRGLLLSKAAVWLLLTSCADPSDPPAAPAVETPAAPRPNVVLVTLDTTRADRLGAYGYKNATTPHMDALAAAGRRFEWAYSPLPLTIPSHASMFTGLYPPELGIRGNGDGTLKEEVVTLAERLNDAGYATAASVAAFVTTRQWGFGQGFDEYYDDIPEPERGNFWHAERAAEEVIDDALAWKATRAGDGPEFVWVHLYDAHFPYSPRKEYWEQHEGRPYDAEIAYVDDQVGRLVDAWAGEPTVFVLAGDHGEGLGEHGELTHGLFVYDATQRVPLVISGPGVPAEVVTQPVSLVDLTPTLLDLLDLPPLEGVTGVPVPSAEHGPVYMESYQLMQRFGLSPVVGIVQPDHKLIATARPELYLPGTELDEDGDIAGEAGEVVSEMLAALEEMEFAPPSDEVGADLDPETRMQLQALGYVQGGFAGDLDGPLPDHKDRDDLIKRSQAAERRMILEKTDEAVEILRGLIDDYPEVIEFRNRLAMQLGRNGRQEEARQVIEEALEIDPTNPMLTLAFAVALAQSQDYAEATRLFQEVAQEMPYSPKVRPMAVASLKQSGDLQGAIRLAAEYLEQYPEDWSVAGMLGVMLVDLGQMTRGIALLEAGAQAERPERDVCYMLAAVALGKGQRDRARELLERELATHPRNERAALTLLNVAALLKDWHLEERVAAALLEQRPDDPLIMHARVLALFNQERYLESREQLDVALEVTPDLAILQLMHANLQAKEGKRQVAEQTFLAAKTAKANEDALIATARRDGRPHAVLQVPGLPGAQVPLSVLPARYEHRVRLEQTGPVPTAPPTPAGGGPTAPAPAPQ